MVRLLPAHLHPRPFLPSAGNAAEHGQKRYTTLHCTALHCTALHYSTVRYSIAQYSTVHCTTVHYSTPQYTTIHCIPLHHSTLYHTAQHHTGEFSALPEVARTGACAPWTPFRHRKHSLAAHEHRVLVAFQGGQYSDPPAPTACALAPVGK